MIPRADRILMAVIGAEDGRELKDGVLYSDSIYVKGRFRRYVIAYAHSNSGRASGVRLEATSYEEAECPKERCYAYKEQLLESYRYVR